MSSISYSFGHRCIQEWGRDECSCNCLGLGDCVTAVEILGLGLLGAIAGVQVLPVCLSEAAVHIVPSGLCCAASNRDY